MQSKSRSVSPRILAAIGVIIIAGALIAYYFTVTPTMTSQSSQISSLSTAVSSLSKVVTSQKSEIESLQSQASSGASMSSTQATSEIINATQTVTLISTTTETSTATPPGVATTTTTSTMTSTVTSTMTSTIALATKTLTTTIASTTTLVFIPSGTDMWSLNGQLSIPGGNGSGTLQLMVADTGSDAITGISVSVPVGPDPTMDLCTSTCSIQLAYDGNAVSTSSPLPGGNNASGSLSTDEGLAGDSYILFVTVTFLDGTLQTQSLTLSPQS